MSHTVHSLPNAHPSIPTTGHTQTSGRINECIATIEREFDAAVDENSKLKLQRDAAERKLLAQINELEGIRQALYDLEAHHARDRQNYEDNIREIRNQLHDARRQAHNPERPPGLGSVGSAPPLPSSQHNHAEPLQRKPLKPGVRLSLDKRTTTLETEHSQQTSTSDETPASLQPPQQLHSMGVSPARQVTQQLQSPPTQACDAPHSDTAVHSNSGDDWTAQINVHTPQIVEVELMNSFWHDGAVCCVRFSMDGQRLATGCQGSAQIYDVKTGRKTHVLVEPNETTAEHRDMHIRCVCFSPDGKCLATGGENKRILVWDIVSEQPNVKAVLRDHEHEIHSLQFSPDGALLVSGSMDGTVRMWDVEKNHCTVLAAGKPGLADTGVASVAISPNGRLVAAGSLDAVIRVWEIASTTLVASLEGHRDAVYSVIFTPDAKGLVSGSLDRTMKFWDVAPLYDNPPPRGLEKKREAGNGRCECLQTYQGHQDYVLSAAVSYDGRWIVSGSKDRDVQLWDARTAVPQLTLRCHKNTVFSVDLHPTSGVFATGSGDSRARLWRFVLVD